MNAESTTQTDEYQIITCSIRSISSMEDFEDQLFDLTYRNIFKDRVWKNFDREQVPVGMKEIVKICRGEFKKERTIDIDLTAPRKDQVFLCFIVYFTRGKTSAAFDKNPFSFIVQPDNLKEKVLNTKLRIKIPKDMDLRIAGSPTNVIGNKL